ncbi:hypothetical protein BJX99DRAFT_257801 [Aspergillus californicus]
MSRPYNARPNPCQVPPITTVEDKMADCFFKNHPQLEFYRAPEYKVELGVLARLKNSPEGCQAVRSDLSYFDSVFDSLEKCLQGKRNGGKFGTDAARAETSKSSDQNDTPDISSIQTDLPGLQALRAALEKGEKAVAETYSEFQENKRLRTLWYRMWEALVTTLRMSIVVKMGTANDTPLILIAYGCAALITMQRLAFPPVVSDEDTTGSKQGSLTTLSNTVSEYTMVIGPFLSRFYVSLCVFLLGSWGYVFSGLALYALAYHASDYLSASAPAFYSLGLLVLVIAF